MYHADDFLDSILNEPDELDAKIESLLASVVSATNDTTDTAIGRAERDDDDDDDDHDDISDLDLKRILSALREDMDDSALTALPAISVSSPHQSTTTPSPPRDRRLGSDGNDDDDEGTSESNMADQDGDDDEDEEEYHEMMGAESYNMNSDFDMHFGDLMRSPSPASTDTTSPTGREASSQITGADGDDDGGGVDNTLLLEASPSPQARSRVEASHQARPDTSKSAKRVRRSSSRAQNAEQINSAVRSIMRVDSMGNLSHYISNPATVQQMGRPRTITVAPSLTAIGTSHGLILLFVNNEDKVTVLKIVDSSKGASNVNAINSVTAMDISPSGDCIIAGYERGQIVVWDTKTRSAVRKITDCFTAPVDFLFFLHDRNKFIASSQGLVKMISVNKMLFSHFSDIKTIVDRSFGPVRHLHVLPQAQASHETNDYIIIAIATDQEVMVLTLQPTLKVIARMARPEGIGHHVLPYLAWRRVLSSLSLEVEDNSTDRRHEQSEKKAHRLKGKNPILAIGWGNVLNFFQLQKLENLELFKIQTLTLEDRFGSTLGMAWLDERIVAVLESNGHVCLFDPFSNRASLECKSVKHIETVSHARFHVADTSTKRSTVVPAYHHSYFALAGNMYLLGERGVLSIKALTWKNRIDALIDIKCYDDAFKIGMQFFKGSAVAAVGLPTETSLRQKIVGKELTKHLLKYFNETVSGFSTTVPPFTPTELQREYALLGKKCLAICLRIDRSDLIFNDIFTTFKANGQEKVFFDMIEQFIIDKQLNHVPMEFISVLLQAYSSTHNKSPEQIAQNLDKLENIILNLYIPRSIETSAPSPTNDMADMNIEFVTILMEHCTHHRMYRALIYLYNTAKDDYITPITLLLHIIEERTVERVDTIVAMLFDYLDQCFRGEAFPSRERNAPNIPHDRLFILKQELLNFVFKSVDDTIKARDYMVAAHRFPYLTKLLHLNTQRLFETLLYVFLDDTPTSPWFECNRDALFTNPKEQKEGERDRTIPKSSGKKEQQAKDSPQRVRDVPSTSDTSSYTSTQKPSHLKPNYTATQPMINVISRQEMVSVLYKIMIDESVNLFSPWEIGQARSWPTSEEMDLFFRFLLTVASNSIIEIDANVMQRAIAVLGWNATTMYDSQEKKEVQEDIVAVLRQRSGRNLSLDLHNVINLCEKANFYKVIAELRVRARHYDKALEAYLKDQDLQKEAFDFINELVSGVSEDSSTFAEIKITAMNNLSELMRLNSDQTARLIIRHFSSEYKSIINKLKPFPRLQYEYLKNIIQNSSVEMADLLQRKNIELDEDMYFQYFTLMCQFEKDSVYDFLKTYQRFRIDECLKVCQKYNITDATSYLLERAGDIPGAINLYQKKLHDDQRVLTTRLANAAKGIKDGRDWTAGMDSFQYINFEIQCILFPQSASDTTKFRHLKNRLDFEASLPLIRESDGRMVSAIEIHEYSQMMDNLQITIEMCQRNTDNNTLDPEEAKTIWFEVLDIFVQPLRELRVGYHGKFAIMVRKQQSKSHNSLSDEPVYVDEAIVANELASVNSEIAILRNRKNDISSQLKYEYREEKKEELKKQIEQCTTHMKSLAEEQTQWKQLMGTITQEKERRTRDPLAPNNLPKVTNLWLQLCYSTCIRAVFEQMVGYIPLENIVSTIATRYRNDELGHFKEPLIDLYDKYEYEMILYRNMRHLIQSDSYNLHRSYVQDYARGVKPAAVNCSLCNAPLFDLRIVTTTASGNNMDSEACVFHCGHGFHARCLHGAGITKCPTCSPVELARALRSRSLAGSHARGSNHPIETGSMTYSNLSRRLNAVETKLNSNSRYGMKFKSIDDEDCDDEEIDPTPKGRLHGIDRSQLTSRRDLDSTRLRETRVVSLVSSFDELLE